jgi:uncharacterized membrane protein
MIRQKRVFQPERIRLGRALRKNQSPMMKRRRAALALAMGATAALGLLAAYQTGLIKHLPDPPWKRFKADAVSSTGEGYLFGIPDALLGMASYSLTGVLIFAGPPDRAVSNPWWPVLAAAKSWFDAGNGIRLAKIQIKDLRFYCIYCLSITTMTVAMVPLTWPEARVAAGVLRKRLALASQPHGALQPTAH